MTRSQSEAIANTIIAAVAPLFTKADLESMKEQMAAKTDIERVNTRIESAKTWILITLAGLFGVLVSMLVIAAI